MQNQKRVKTGRRRPFAALTPTEDDLLRYFHIKAAIYDREQDGKALLELAAEWKTNLEHYQRRPLRRLVRFLEEIVEWFAWRASAESKLIHVTREQLRKAA